MKRAGGSSMYGAFITTRITTQICQCDWGKTTGRRGEAQAKRRGAAERRPGLEQMNELGIVEIVEGYLKTYGGGGGNSVPSG